MTITAEKINELRRFWGEMVEDTKATQAEYLKNKRNGTARRNYDDSIQRAGGIIDTLDLLGLSDVVGVYDL